jgi:hypothetical protein
VPGAGETGLVQEGALCWGEAGDLLVSFLAAALAAGEQLADPAADGRLASAAAAAAGAEAHSGWWHRRAAPPAGMGLVVQQVLQVLRPLALPAAPLVDAARQAGSWMRGGSFPAGDEDLLGSCYGAAVHALARSQQLLGMAHGCCHPAADTAGFLPCFHGLPVRLGLALSQQVCAVQRDGQSSGSAAVLGGMV